MRASPLLLPLAALVAASLACQTVLPDRRTPIIEPTAELDETQNTEGVEQPISDDEQPADDEQPVADDAYVPLSGPTETYASEHFRIHYTFAGIDAVPNDDYNDDGAPDYVVEVGQVLEEVRALYIDEWGWAAPPPDGEMGGDARYDVYIGESEDGEVGYVFSPETLPNGDNPNTPEVTEDYASGSFMRIVHDYAPGTGFENEWLRKAYLRTTIAHEYIHSLQYGYDALEPDTWMWEGVAMWVEDNAYPGYSNDIAYIDDYTAETGGCIEQADPYGLWVWFRYLAERHDRDLIREIWEQARALEGLEAIDAALQARGDSLGEAWEGFLVAMLTRDFQRGVEMEPLSLDATLTAGEDRTAELGRLGFEVIRLDASGPVTVDLSQNESQLETFGLLVGIDAGQASVFPLVDGAVSVDAGAFDDVYALVYGFGAYEACREADYTLTLTPGGDPATATRELEAPLYRRLK
jgi:hypothetical protein